MVTRKILDYLSGKSSKKRTCKRAHPRLKAFNLIKFTLSDGTHYESLSNILDISENGLRFTCYETLPAGAKLKMLVALPDKNKEVPLDAQLIWMRPMKTVKGVYVAGVTFTGVSAENRELIRQMVRTPNRFHRR